jgi:hypothetical protein
MGSKSRFVSNISSTRKSLTWAVASFGFVASASAINAFSPKAWTRMMDLSPDPNAQQSPPPEDDAPVVSYLLSDTAAGISGQVVQRRGAAFVIVAHPQITHFEAFHHGWNVATAVEHFDPILRKHQQHVG